ncbi:MAG TPA: hypothetical protein VNZ58_12930 [Thermomicrobiales bacterium]|nr:hypothetical protein [Thermomicrobiales bacterium]
MFKQIRHIGVASVVALLVAGSVGTAFAQDEGTATGETEYEGASEIVASIREGTCDNPADEVKWEIVDETDEYRGIQYPVVDSESTYPVVHEDSTFEMTLDDVAGLIIMAQNKPENPTATVCGEIKGRMFDEKLAVALRPIDGSNAGGVATFHMTSTGKLYVMVYFVENMSGK